MKLKQFNFDVITAYRCISWKIWVYLKVNPDVLEVNKNQEVLDEVAKIQTNMYLRNNPDQMYEEAFSTLNFCRIWKRNITQRITILSKNCWIYSDQV